MNRLVLGVIGIVVVLLAILASSALFTVYQSQQALVLQFGNPKRIIVEPGLYLKLPFIQEALYYERRILSLDPPVELVILADQKRLLVDPYVRYRITDPLRFFQTVKVESRLRDRLGAIVNAGVRGVLGNATLSMVLSAERSKIMSDIDSRVNAEAKRFGIEVVDVRLRRADLPEQTSQAVYARMRSEREREAAEFRAQGYERAQQVAATADREATVVRAEAEKESQILRGEGDREKTRITREAYGKDLEFYRFYKSMTAYEYALRAEDTTLVLSPDSEFFRYFGSITGGYPAVTE
jgi:membrane protease subunit HflC